MSSRCRNALAIASCLLAPACGTARQSFYLRDGDLVVFYGDSITARGEYTTVVEAYVRTRFPRLRVRFVNAGWGGDRVSGGEGGAIDLRLERDVVRYKPTVMTMMLGMNDGSYRAYDADIFNTYASGFRGILDSVKKALPDVRITVIQPSAFDDVTRPPQFEGGYNRVLMRYGQFVRDLGQHQRLIIADANAPLVAVLEKAKAINLELAKEIIPDRVHPSHAGGLLIAEALLKTWNAPATVTAVEINGRTKRVLRSVNTKLSLFNEGSGLRWTQEDGALPMPIDLNDSVVTLAARSSDVVRALDQQTLKVTGLSAARYTLQIDDEQVGMFSKEELAAGINLAMLPTPMVKQAMNALDLTRKHGLIHFIRWQIIQVPLGKEGFLNAQAAAAALDRLEEEEIERQRATAQPKTRHYRLIPR
jgi:lysophospholipase L1-like esterase